MSILKDTLTTLKDSTLKRKMLWVPLSSGQGFLTATTKGSIRLERIEFNNTIIVSFTNPRGFELNTFVLDSMDPLYDEYLNLFKLVRERVLNVTANIDSILSELNDEKPTTPLDEIFPGSWRNDYIIGGKDNGAEFPIVFVGDRYILNGKHWFNVVNVTMDEKKLKFTKVGLGTDQRRLVNNLDIIDRGKHYEGSEVDENSEEDITHKVKYTKID